MVDKMSIANVNMAVQMNYVVKMNLTIIQYVK